MIPAVLEPWMRLLSLFKPFTVMMVLCWGLWSVEVHAVEANLTSIEQLRDAALRHARSAVPEDAQIAAGSLDARLRLPACATPLATRTASETANRSALHVEVRCDSAGWKLYVPVSVQVQVPVLVALRPLARGASVSAGDVEVQRRDRASVGAQALSDPEQLVGQVVSRPIAAGTVLAAGVMAPLRLVKRGQAVTILGESGSFQIRAQGKALGDGSAGELIRVENLSSRRVVEGRIGTDGSVRVGL